MTLKFAFSVLFRPVQSEMQFHTGLFLTFPDFHTQCIKMHDAWPMNPWNLCDNELSSCEIVQAFFSEENCLKLVSPWQPLSRDFFPPQSETQHKVIVSFSLIADTLLFPICLSAQILYHSFWTAPSIFFAWMAIAAIRLSHWPDGNIDWLDHPWCSDVLFVKGTKLQHLGILVVKLPSLVAMIVESFVNYNPWNVRSPLRPWVLVLVHIFGQGEGCLKVADARVFFLAEIWDGEICAGLMCHVILESCKQNTLQKMQYSSFDSFSVCFQVSVFVLLSFPLWGIPNSTVPEKMKTPVSRKGWSLEETWPGVVRPQSAGAPSLQPWKTQKPSVSWKGVVSYCHGPLCVGGMSIVILYMYTLFLTKKWMKVILLKIARGI